jgi:DNA-binding PadR family transcriptional regulator
MLELAVLGLLKEKPMHGYDLRKQLRAHFGPLANLSFGSLYPALARLQSAGAVRTISPNSPPGHGPSILLNESLLLTGSLGGERASLVARRATAKAAAALGGRGTKARKIYEITERGNEMFEELLDAPGGQNDDASSFSLRLAFARHLSPQARIRLLERRWIQLTDRLQRAGLSLARPDRALDTYERSIAEHSRETVANDVAWIESLLAKERRGLNDRVQVSHKEKKPKTEAVHRRRGNVPRSDATSATRVNERTTI